MLDNFRGQYKNFNNLISIEKIQNISLIECAIICRETFHCISFSFEMNENCLFYDHAWGNYFI